MLHYATNYVINYVMMWLNLNYYVMQIELCGKMTITTLDFEPVSVTKMKPGCDSDPRVIN